MTTATSPRAVAKSATTQPDTEREERLASLAALALEQRANLRADALQLMESLTTGLNRALENNWTYTPADMPSADGSGWKRIPRLALVLAQLDAVRHTLDWQLASSLSPLWCVPCDGPFPGAPYLNNPCIDHDATPSSAVSWLSLWGAGK